jgi:hypothetical protein
LFERRRMPVPSSWSTADATAPRPDRRRADTRLGMRQAGILIGEGLVDIDEGVTPPT